MPPIVPSYPGCTDPLAINYNTEANVDDGSCEYGTQSILITIDSLQFNVVVFEDTISSQTLTIENTGFDTLEVSLDGGESDILEVDENLFTYGGEFEGHHYFVSNNGTTWSNAKNICEEQGGHLATITSETENSFVANLNNDNLWIGFTDEASEGNFYWITGEEVTYTNWGNSQPDNSGSEDYVHINWNTIGKWNDHQSSQTYNYVLEIYNFQSIPDWLILFQTTLTIPPGENANVDVTVSGADLEYGDYEATIQLTSNDPDNPIVEVAVTMAVQYPIAEVPGENIEFGEVGFNSITNYEIPIINTGNYDLSIVGTTHVSPLQLVIDSLLISPNDTGYINIQLSAELEEMTINDTLILTTNDPANSLIEIPISALIVPDEHPIISSIEDVPNDQGGKVVVSFTRSYHDTDSLRNGELYSIEINNGNGWINANSSSAYGEANYSSYVDTPIDSSSTSDGLLAFRIIANMEEGNFVSETLQGYSVDNINPTEPVGMTLQYGVNDNQLNMDWQANSDDDLSHYIITQNNEIISTPEISEFNGEINLSTGVYSFSLKAVDIHGNESNSVEKEIYIIENELISGNNLIGIPGTFENDSSIELLNGLIDIGPHIYFMLGQGVGIFNTTEGWSGNLNNIQPHNGYWLNISTSYNWRNNPELGAVQNCENFETIFGNNLLSFRWGDGDKPILDALGGEAFATENFNFILGQGVGLFNTADGWSGNLNTLKEGKGYWLNVSSYNLDFKWGFENCADPENTPLLMEKQITQIPDEYQFVQSTEQAFYLIKDIENVVNGDLVLAYCGDQLVGSAIWEGEYTAIPVMGRDLSEQTEGFCELNEVPLFVMKSLNSASDINNLNSLNGDLNGFTNLGVYTIDKMVLDEIKIIPTDWSLAPAYPNPFNPVTTINFGIPAVESLRVTTLQIYDINGRLIETLIDSQIEAGFHTVEWDASGLPSGVYFIKMMSGDHSINSGQGFIQTQKVILMK